MAIVKMKHLRVVAMQSDREAILHTLQRTGCVEIDEPRVDWSDPLWAGLGRSDGEQLSAAKERKSEGEQALTVLKRYAPKKGGLLSSRPILTEGELFEPQACAQAEQAVRSINDTQRRITALQAQQSKLEGQRVSLEPWLSLDLPLETKSTKEVTIYFGTVPSAVEMQQLEQAVGQVSDLVELTQAGRDREYQYLLLVCHRKDEEQVLEVMKDYGWSRSNLRDWTGTAAENDRRIQQELDQIAQDLAQAREQLAEQGGLHDSICQNIDRASMDISREDARGHLLDTRNAFFMEGWVPAERWEQVSRELGKFDCAFEAEDPAQEEYPNVPVKLKNNFLTRSLSTVTEMYSLPAYGAVDPNPLMAPFFILFYGMMMADMGYGILMMLGCGVILKKKRPANSHFFELFFWCGVATFIWGALTGGFFGDAPYQVVKLLNPQSTWEGLPALFNPLDDALMVLIGSLVLGVVQIFTGMAVSMIRKIKSGNTMQALCEEGAWYLVFVLLGAGALTGQWSVALIAIVVLLVLTQGYGKKGIGAKAMAIGGSLYNNITGYFSDILSYSRLMALMLAGAVIAQVFNTLGAITGNIVTFLIISIIGNALNMGLNLLGCYVHDLRLQCLEYFGRFYEDGGKPFRPLDMTTKYVEIQKD